jgi:NAD(P)-dependent dehydrogenase (short-subunit alcohol dehydrogenase family)
LKKGDRKKVSYTERITVNAISPGPFGTEMNTALIQNPELNQQFLSKIPLGRWGRVEEIGRLTFYLCSEDAGFITGTDILIEVAGRPNTPFGGQFGMLPAPLPEAVVTSRRNAV